MWEMTSGVSAFHNIPHDLNLSLNICKGIRPEIVEGTMSEYIPYKKSVYGNGTFCIQLSYVFIDSV
jgi:hypothetical protein